MARAPTMLARLFRSLFAKRRAAQPAARDILHAESGVRQLLDEAARLGNQGKTGEATARLREVLAREPGNAEARHTLGVLAQWANRHEEALDHFVAAIDAPGAEAHPLYPLFLANRGRLQVWFGDLERGFADLDRAISLKPDLAFAHSVRLMASQYRPGLDPVATRELHRKWAALFADPHTPAAPMQSGSRDPGRRLKLGYVSPDFRRHSVAWFFEPLLAHRDAARFEVILYSSSASTDEVSTRLRAQADAWRDITTLDDAAAARRIAEDGIDLLVDLAGHTSGNRLGVFARRPAPVQITVLGYPATTGMRAMDYRLSDARVDPPGASDAHYTERLLRLPRCLWCFRAPLSPPVGPLPALKNGFVTFGSFNNVGKLSDACLALWAGALKAIPTSRLLIAGAESWETRLRIQERFDELGIDGARITFEGKRDYAGFLALRDAVDIALDSTPFGGATTTCDSLWMGVPVLALVGDRCASRACYSILHSAGLEDWAASDAAAFAAVAAARAADLPALARLREGLRTQLAASPLCDETGFARDTEAAYLAAWRNWCAEGGPA